MQKRIISGYIRVGVNLTIFRSVVPGKPIGRQMLSQFLYDLNKYGLTSTLRAAEKLNRAFPQATGKGTTVLLDEKSAKRVREAAAVMSTVLFYEAQAHIAYVTTEKRFRIECLLEDVGELFGDKVYERLPALARDDFADAGRALAFELPTPAASMMARATEAVLCHFYESNVRQRNKRINSRLWGPLVDELK